MATINLGSIKFNWQGAYAGGTAYAVDDVVSYNGSSYICKLASTGNLPTNTTYWDQMSSAGTNGTDGTDVGTVITTQGDILYRDGSGLQRLGAGTSGQVLQTGGTGANPSWGTVSSDYVKIAETTVSSYVSEVNFEGYFSTTYKVYKIIMDATSSTASQFRVRFGYGATPTYITGGDYKWVSQATHTNFGGGTTSSSWADAANSSQFIQLSFDDDGTSFDQKFSAEITFFNLEPSNISPNLFYIKNGNSSSWTHSGMGAGWGYNSNIQTNQVSGIKIFRGSGGINAGTFKLYGIK